MPSERDDGRPEMNDASPQETGGGGKEKTPTS